MRTNKRIFIVVTLALLGIWNPLAIAQEKGGTDLRAAVQNPVGAMYSLPFKFNFDYGAPNGEASFLNIQPVIPITVGDWNYINRIIAPLIDTPGQVTGTLVYDADTRTILDNHKATVGSRTEGLRKNDDGSITMMIGPDAPPKGWEANYVRTIPGRGWFPYLRGFGAGPEFFNDEYKLPTVKEV